jgi:hypothetical protein
VIVQEISSVLEEASWRPKVVERPLWYFYERGKGCLLEVKVLANTVNTVGVMGKGLALQFKKAYSEMFRNDKKTCKSNVLQPGMSTSTP